jgi:hypothetical protein
VLLLVVGGGGQVALLAYKVNRAWSFCKNADIGALIAVFTNDTPVLDLQKLPAAVHFDLFCSVCSDLI